jgi:hypothetical protein
MEVTARERPRIATVLAGFAVAVLTIPWSMAPITGGLDQSWRWGLNAFSNAGVRFGRDLIFTYGPLGYLALPLDIGRNLETAHIVHLVVHASIFATVGVVLTRKWPLTSVWLFLATFTIWAAWDIEFDYRLLAAAGLMAAAAIETQTPALLVASAVAASVLLFIKFATGVAGLAMLIVAGMLWWTRQRSIRPLIATAAASMLTVAVTSAWSFGSVSGFLAFVRLSTIFASGYNDAMSVLGPDAPLRAAGFLLVLTGVIAAALLRRRVAAAVPFIVFAVPLLFSAKHAFQRADWVHMPYFFTLLWWIGSSALLLAVDVRTRAWCLLLLAADLGLFAATTDPPELTVRTQRLLRIVTGREARANVTALIDARGARRAARKESRERLVHDLLPDEWRTAIGRHSVLVLPWELALCPANGLNCVPYPTVQMYATLTSDLDRWTAETLRRQPADYAIVDVGAIDGRNMVWDCPETWRALIELYEIDRRAVDRPRLLLKRRNEMRPWHEELLTAQSARIGQWIAVPPNEHPLRAAIALRRRALGWLWDTFFRSAPVSLQVITASGRSRAYRIVVDTARDAILVDAPLRSAADVATLFDCCPFEDPVRAIRITGQGTSAFDSSLSIIWSSLSSAVASTHVPALESRPAVGPGEVLGGVDTINDQSVAAAKGPLVVQASRTGFLQVSGWAIDRRARNAARSVIVRWDGGRLEVPADYGFDRIDVANLFSEPGYRMSGFRGVVAADDLGRGMHQLDILVVAADGSTTTPFNLTIDVDAR